MSETRALDSRGDGALKSHEHDLTETEDEFNIKFHPPLYEQRYRRVTDVLISHNVSSVADFGCAECKALRLFISMSQVTRLVGVDIEKDLLIGSMWRVTPLITSYLFRRPLPLTVQLYCGSLLNMDERLAGLEAVTMIEVLEHLVMEDVDKLPEALFGVLAPRLVVMTTPNSEFNVLFPRLGDGFRHPDHKFEWTRKQFQSWCNAAASLYGYDVVYEGIGEAPEGYQHLGGCSQMAIFTRSVSIATTSAAQACCCSSAAVERSDGPLHGTGDERNPYELVHEVEYPAVDQSTLLSREQQILNEAIYYLNTLARYRSESTNHLLASQPVDNNAVDCSKVPAADNHLVECSKVPAADNYLVECSKVPAADSNVVECSKVPAADNYLVECSKVPAADSNVVECSNVPISSNNEMDLSNISVLDNNEVKCSKVLTSDNNTAKCADLLGFGSLSVKSNGSNAASVLANGTVRVDSRDESQELMNDSCSVSAKLNENSCRELGSESSRVLPLTGQHESAEFLSDNRDSLPTKVTSLVQSGSVSGSESKSDNCSVEASVTNEIKNRAAAFVRGNRIAARCDKAVLNGNTAGSSHTTEYTASASTTTDLITAGTAAGTTTDTTACSTAAAAGSTTCTASGTTADTATGTVAGTTASAAISCTAAGNTACTTAAAAGTTASAAIGCTAAAGIAAAAAAAADATACALFPATDAAFHTVSADDGRADEDDDIIRISLSDLMVFDMISSLCDNDVNTLRQVLVTAGYRFDLCNEQTVLWRYVQNKGWHESDITIDREDGVSDGAGNSADIGAGGDFGSDVAAVVSWEKSLQAVRVGEESWD